MIDLEEEIEKIEEEIDLKELKEAKIKVTSKYNKKEEL